MYEYNLASFCFLCLKNNHDENLKNVLQEEEENISLADKIEFLISSDLLLLDLEHPENICSTCEKTLNSFYIFKQMCLENNRRLKYFIANTERDKIDPTDVQTLQTSRDDIVENLETSNDNIEEHNENRKEPSKPVSEEVSLAELKQEIFEFLEKHENKMEQEKRDASKEETLETEDGDISNEATRSDDYNHNEIENSYTNETDVANLLKITSKVLRYQCCYCDKSYFSKSGLRKHLKTHHTDSLSCSNCQTKFPTKSTLKGNNLNNTTNKYSKCQNCKAKLPYCDKSTKTKVKKTSF